MNTSDHFPFPRNPVIEAHKKDVDRSLIRENLKLTPEQRVLQLMELQKMALELKKAGVTVRNKS